MHADGAARNYMHCVHIFSDIFKNNDASQRVNVVTSLFNASSSPFNAFPPPFHAYRRSLTPLCRPLSLPIDLQRLFVAFYGLFVVFGATPWPFRTSPSHFCASHHPWLLFVALIGLRLSIALQRFLIAIQRIWHLITKIIPEMEVSV